MPAVQLAIGARPGIGHAKTSFADTLSWEPRAARARLFKVRRVAFLADGEAGSCACPLSARGPADLHAEGADGAPSAEECSAVATDDIVLRLEGEIVAFDEVAIRRERLAAYAASTRAVVVYRFMMPEAATAPSLGPLGAPRDARDQLHLIVGMLGGGITKSHGGLAARIPKTVAVRFEALARPLIEAFLVSIDLG